MEKQIIITEGPEQAALSAIQEVKDYCRRRIEDFDGNPLALEGAVRANMAERILEIIRDAEGK